VGNRVKIRAYAHEYLSSWPTRPGKATDESCVATASQLDFAIDGLHRQAGRQAGSVLEMSTGKRSRMTLWVGNSSMRTGQRELGGSAGWRPDLFRSDCGECRHGDMAESAVPRTTAEEVVWPGLQHAYMTTGRQGPSRQWACEGTGRLGCLFQSDVIGPCSSWRRRTLPGAASSSRAVTDGGLGLGWARAAGTPCSFSRSGSGPRVSGGETSAEGGLAWIWGADGNGTWPHAVGLCITVHLSYG
jgi:hypothetical protein